MGPGVIGVKKWGGEKGGKIRGDKYKPEGGGRHYSRVLGSALSRFFRRGA